MKYFLVLIILLFFNLHSFSQEDIERMDNGKKEKYMSVRIVPAFFWNTISIEFERQIKKKISIGLNTTITFGRDIDNDRLVQANTQSNAILNQGFALDLIVKKYFSSDFNGFFVSASASYNSIEYFNIDKKPYTLFNSLPTDTKEEILENDIQVTNVYGGCLGLGYQVVMIPDHLIVNVEGGVATYLTVTNVPFFSLYLAPSIGYKF